MTTRRARLSLLAALALLLAPVVAARAEDVPAPVPNLPAAPSAPPPAGIRDDQPGTDVRERVTEGEDAMERARRADADAKVKRAIRAGVDRAENPPPPPVKKHRRHSAD